MGHEHDGSTAEDVLMYAGCTAQVGYPFHCQDRGLATCHPVACTTRGRTPNCGRGSRTTRRAWTTWTGCAGLPGRCARSAAGRRRRSPAGGRGGAGAAIKGSAFPARQPRPAARRPALARDYQPRLDQLQPGRASRSQMDNPLPHIGAQLSHQSMKCFGVLTQVDVT